MLDGRTLTAASVDRAARGAAVAVDAAALDRVAAAYETVQRVAGRRAVYGRTTGVGANRHEGVAGPGAAGHGLRLLRSHAACLGPVEDGVTVRAMLVARLNQLLTGGAGVHPRVAAGLIAALQEGALPTVHRLGAVGTGDLAPLAETALTLAGERPWSRGSLDPVPLDSGDALAFISSAALTIATAALAVAETGRLLRAADMVAALSFCALEGAAEAYAEPVHAARPHPGTVSVAAALRALLGHPDAARPARRIQDPYGLRTVPQVHGAAREAASHLEDVLGIELNAAAENPLVSTSADDVFHHGQFHTAALALALDHLRAALLPVAALSAARLGDLVDPAISGLPAFLAAGPAGSSGVMIVEYVVQDVLAELRALAAPASTGTAVVSLGLEEHASFATQGARQATAAARALPLVLAGELVAAVRAQRMAADRLPDAPVRAAYDLAAAALDPEPLDRVLGPDLEAGVALLPALAALAQDSSGRSSSA